jgi:ribose/xylose/arabinose/galactoside ABC-type transport system permease subunit
MLAPVPRLNNAASVLRFLGSYEFILLLLVLVELVVFSIIGTNFLSIDNAFELARLSVEIGLLALVMTPVIVSGGIDLSVGSLLGLSSVLLGRMWDDLGLPIGLAAVLTVAAGLAAGGLNALVITRLRVPPLIATLGTLSLFRGLAEGLAYGSKQYPPLPEPFAFLGQGYVFDVIPTQLLIFPVVAVAVWLLLHRTTIGRAWYAIGFSAEAARYAGIPVERRLALAYILSGGAAGLAGVIYVSHLGEIKANAGTGYELMAITAVVLGGTSIFGGRGKIHGTLLGLIAIAALQRGLRMADLPAELGGILTGILLLAAVGANTIGAKLIRGELR